MESERDVRARLALLDAKRMNIDHVGAELLACIPEDSTPARSLVFYVNERRFELDGSHVDPEANLFDFLRNENLTGTKQGCLEGGCGACTVMLTKWDPVAKKPISKSVVSCLLPICFIDHMVVTTVEGLGQLTQGLPTCDTEGVKECGVHGQTLDPAHNVHPVQERLAVNHATQCGYCTPGFAVNIATALQQEEGATVEDLEECISGNLCRCTGYRPILETAVSFAKDFDPKTAGSLMHDAKKKHKKRCANCPNAGKRSEEVKDSEEDWWGDKTAMYKTLLDFPEEFKKEPNHLLMSGQFSTWFRPQGLQALLAFKSRADLSEADVEVVAGKTRCAQFLGTELVCGNTDRGYRKRYHPDEVPRLMVSLQGVPELRKAEFTEEGMVTGAGLAIEDLHRTCKKAVGTLPAEKTGFCRAFIAQVLRFANPMVRNVGTLGGSLCAADPLSDLYPIWMASGALIHAVHLTSEGVKERVIPVREFTTGPKQHVLQANEIVTSIFIPWSTPRQFIRAYKIGKRYDDCQAWVNACFSLTIGKNKIVSGAQFGIGALSQQTFLAKNARAAVLGKPVSSALFQEALAAFDAEVKPRVYKRLGHADARFRAIRGLFFGFWVGALKDLGFAVPEELELSAEAFKPPKYGDRSFKQQWVEKGALESKEEHPMIESAEHANVEIQKATKEALKPLGAHEVGRPHPHQSAMLHATGQAEYVGDLPLPKGGLHAAPVMAKRAHARIKRIDASEALAMPTVHGFVCAKDIPAGGQNKLGCLVEDEEVFASDEVHFFGQVIGLTLADDPNVAREAARAVKVEYEDLPFIVDMREAIEKKSFFHDWHRRIECGDVEAVFEAAQDEKNEDLVIVSGEQSSAPQDHMYIETNNIMVVPNGDCMTVWAASQNPGKMQDAVSKILGVPMHAVVTNTMRLGGGFGGKQDRPQFLVAAAAVAASKMGRPVRLWLERMEDMQLMGMRHPYLGQYKVAITKTGEIQAMKMHFYTDGGHSLDLTSAQLDRGMWCAENSYLFQNLCLTGTCVRTNKVSHTAYRGFGVPECLAILETAIEHAATAVGMNAVDVRAKHLYSPGDPTPVGHKLKSCTTKDCWGQLLQSSKYEELKKEVEVFNRSHRFRKRGLTVMPCRQCTFFEADFMDTQGSLIMVYQDGSVLVSHGGVEMGQGIHTKMAMIAAETLGVPYTRVRTGATCTNKVPNTHPTAASSGSDLNGWAVFNGCQQLNERLAPVKVELKKKLGRDATWDEVINHAYFHKINLCANGHFNAPDFVYDYETKKGRTSFYYIWGAILCEAEVNVLTGEARITKAHIVQDAGHSLNPAIDVGQLEGGFMQGLGLFTMEEPIWAKSDGHLRTRNVSTYKIPSPSDTPDEFHVTFLADAPNREGGIYSQKSTGEVGVISGVSCLLAMRNAVAAYRKEQGMKGQDGSEWFQFDAPATISRISDAIGDLKLKLPVKQ